MIRQKRTSRKQVIGATESRFPTLKEAEQMHIEAALNRAGGNQGIAATLLGISRPALNRRLARSSTGKEEEKKQGCNILICYSAPLVHLHPIELHNIYLASKKCVLHPVHSVTHLESTRMAKT